MNTRSQIPSKAALISMVISLFVVSLPGQVHGQVDSADLWASARALEDAGQYARAAAIYEQILAQDSDSQKAATKLGVNLYQAGLYQDALNRIDASIEMNPYSRVWAEWGYLYRARICRELGCDSIAAESIAVLRSRFPDSISTARAEVLDSELEGVGALAANDQVDAEMAAELLHDEAVQAIREGDTTLAESLFDEVVLLYPDTHKSLRSMEIKGLMLSGLSRERVRDAKAVFQQIIDVVATETPHARVRYEAELRLGYLSLKEDNQQEAMSHFEWLSNNAQDPRFAQNAKTRLAAMYHTSRRMDEAYDLFMDLRDNAVEPNVRSNAALQAAGVFFEMQQAVPWSRESFDYETVRTLCRDVQNLEYANEEELARSKLMFFETYLWEKDPEQCLLLAENFLREYEESGMRRELSTAHLFAGESLQLLHRHDEALVHYRWITGQYETNGEIWPWEQLMSRAYYRVFDALRRTNASTEEIRAAADVVLEEFPRSKHAPLVRIAIGLDESPYTRVVQTGSGPAQPIAE
ncbi:MAG TPA: tetratricopeptide repeat protein [Phycisphaerae bacterium]|nr:tetratricopeptide repeat protein [Phycisphaerae bacterium]